MSADSDPVSAGVAALPYARNVGFEVHDQGGQLLARLPFAEHLVGNPAVPSLHGGVLGGFLQLTAVAHWMRETGATRPPRMFGITVQYLSPGRMADTWGQATITSRGRRFASLRVVAWQDDATRPIVSANVQLLLSPGRPAAA